MENVIDDLQLSSYEFEVPKELIAQAPLAERDASKLLVVRRQNESIEHRQFRDIVEYLDAGDCLVINKTKVVPVRLFGKKETGGIVEALFLDPREFSSGTVRALLKPWMDPGKKIIFSGGLIATVQGRAATGETILLCNGTAIDTLLTAAGHMPLPPYIKRDKSGDGRELQDKQRYQTVYARDSGSIAAPTAGLHFTDQLFARLRERGIEVAEITLHVGWGTFRPLVAATVTDHRMLPECYELTSEAARKINRAHSIGRRVVAVGTTSVRTLESVAEGAGKTMVAATGETSLFIHPGYQFKTVNALITNFHQPQSTPLLLTSAFAGREKIRAAYSEAIRRQYRFFSYGDAMLIL